MVLSPADAPRPVVQEKLAGLKQEMRAFGRGTETTVTVENLGKVTVGPAIEGKVQRVNKVGRWMERVMTWLGWHLTL